MPKVFMGHFDYNPLISVVEHYFRLLFRADCGSRWGLYVNPVLSKFF